LDAEEIQVIRIGFGTGSTSMTHADRSAGSGAFSAGDELGVARPEIGGIVGRSPYAETMRVAVQVAPANY
jgi:hypothetical protein